MLRLIRSRRVGPATFHRLLAEHGSFSRAAEAAHVSQPALSAGVQELERILGAPVVERTRGAVIMTAVGAEAAFGGTFHINETMTQLDDAYAAAAGGGIPSPLPAEIYCHSLTDPTILGPELQAAGAHTLTLFGLQVPHRLAADADADAYRDTLLRAAQVSLDSVLAEPIMDCVYRAPDGSACIEVKTTTDLEHALGMAGGDIFHGALAWPWAGDDEPLDTPAAR